MKKDSAVRSDEIGISYQHLDTPDRNRIEFAIRRGWSRREVLKLIMACGISTVTARHIFSDGQRALAMTPKKGGVVRMASSLHGPDDQLDPILFSSTIDFTRGRILYNNLTQLDADLEAQPELAQEFGPNSNATEWTFKIRKGVRFHDGSSLTANDVVYSMNRHLGESSVSVFKTVVASVKEWKKTGPQEVKAIMNTPNVDLPALLGLFQAKIVKQGSEGGGIGTGPFTLESFEPGIKSLHERNEDYWREPAHLDGLEITAITDPVARVNALIAGDVQMAVLIEPNSFRQIEAAPGVNLLSTPAAQQIGICCLKNTVPGSNGDFVKGLQYIQDRKRIVAKVLKGKGTVANDHPISPAHGADFCTELPQREFDPERARFHFDKSGINSAEIHVAPVAPGIEEIVLLAQTNLTRIGFDLKIKKVPADGYWGTVWMKEPVNVVYWLMAPTANSQIAVQFAPGAPWNDTFWHNTRMGELLKLSLAELNPGRRHDMYCEMQTLIHNESGMVIPAFTNINDAIRDNVKGVPGVPIGPLGGCEWPEFTWLS